MPKVINTDYESKTEFLKSIENWRIESGKTHRELLTLLNLTCTGSYNSWVRPFIANRPLISLKNIAKLSKLSGIIFHSSDIEEKIKYEEIYKRLNK